MPVSKPETKAPPAEKITSWMDFHQKSLCFNFMAEEFANMRKIIRCFAAVMMVFLDTMIFAEAAPAQDTKFDSDSISGLGARNIGSAAMSGRVAAVAEVKENGRMTVYVGAAIGGVWKSS